MKEPRTNKMYASIKRTLRELSHAESMSHIRNREWDERMRACRRAFDTATNRQLKHIRTEHTKNK